MLIVADTKMLRSLEIDLVMARNTVVLELEEGVGKGIFMRLPIMLIP